MQSCENDYDCDCGYKVTLGETGFFSGDDVVFDNVLDWDLWQRDYIKAQVPVWKQDFTKAITSDDGESKKGIQLFETTGKKQRQLMMENAKITLFCDRLELTDETKSEVFMLADISRMGNHRSSGLMFTCGNRYYEASSKCGWPVFKYVALWRFLTGRPYL